MKIALCMWGASRWAEEGSKKFNEMLLSPLLSSGHEVRVYKHCPVSKHLNSHNQGVAWSAHSLFTPQIFSIEDQDEFLLSNPVFNYINHGNPWPERSSGLQTLEMFLISLWSMFKLWSLIEYDDWKPDIFIGYRPDTVLCKAFDTSCFSYLDETNILLPDFSKCPINDRFFVCKNSEIAKTYFCRFIEARSYSNNNKLHSETFLDFILSSKNIKYVDIPVKMMRLRADQSIYKLDKHLQTQHVFIVTSVINPSQNPIHYFSTRSKISAKERFRQTQNTIKTIRYNFLNSYIILVEGSDFDVSSIKHVDQIVYCNDSKISTSPNRSIGEICLTRAGIIAYQNADIKKSENVKFYKMNGRYRFTSSFDIDAWTCEGAAFAYGKDDPLKKRGPRCLTIFYKAWEPNKWLKALDKAEANIGQKSLDTVLPFVDVHKKLIYSGVAGLVAPTGLEFCEFDWQHYISLNFPGKCEGGRGVVDRSLCFQELTLERAESHWKSYGGSQNPRKFNSNKKTVVHITNCNDTSIKEYIVRLAQANETYLHSICTDEEVLDRFDNSCVYLHIHTIRFMSVKPILDFIQKRNIPYFITVHDKFWEYSTDLRKFKSDEINTLFTQARKIILHTHCVFSHYEVLSSFKNVVIVPNIDYWPSSTLHWSGPCNNDKLTIGYMGPNLESKGSKDFTELASLLGKNFNFSRFSNETSELPFIRNILLMPGFDCIGQLREHANIIVFPGSWSSWGFKFGEALASGLPVVYQNIGAFRERGTEYPWHFSYESPQDFELTVRKATDFLKQKGKNKSRGQFSEKNVPLFYKNLYIVSE